MLSIRAASGRACHVTSWLALRTRGVDCPHSRDMYFSVSFNPLPLFLLCLLEFTPHPSSLLRPPYCTCKSKEAYGALESLNPVEWGLNFPEHGPWLRRLASAAEKQTKALNEELLRMLIFFQDLKNSLSPHSCLRGRRLCLNDPLSEFPSFSLLFMYNKIKKFLQNLERFCENKTKPSKQQKTLLFPE